MLLIPLILLAGFQDPQTVDLDRLLALARASSATDILQIVEETEVPLHDQDWRKDAVARLEQAGPKETLMLGRLLAVADYPDAAPQLVTLLDQEHELAMAAASTLAYPAFDFLISEEPQDLIGHWLATAEPQDDPELFCEVALTLNRIGDGDHRTASVETLRGVLSSPSEEVYSATALALARLHKMDNPAVRREVERLAEGFGPKAALAQSLIEAWSREQRFQDEREEFFKIIEGGGSERGRGRVRSRDSAELIENVLNTIQHRHVDAHLFSRDELVEAAANGMLRRLDPHSSYMSGEEATRFMFDLEPVYGGIGAYVNTVDDVFTIIRPIYSGPAYRAGLRTDDKILEVDGWSTQGRSNDEIIKRLKGEPGSEVKVLVYRRGKQPWEVTIDREAIEIPTLHEEMLPGGVLYLELVNFSLRCGEEISDAIRKANRNQDLEGIVLDLRNNPGGYLAQAREVCDVFLPPGKLIVETKSSFEGEDRFKTRRPAFVPEDIPMVVLVNEYSASASEIVAGVLGEHGRAVVLGERTFGKGSIQNLIPLDLDPDDEYEDANGNRTYDPGEQITKDWNDNGQFDYGARMRLTVGYYVLPNNKFIHTQRDHEGRVTEKGGVKPDIVVEFPTVELWKLRELERLYEMEAFDEFADQVYAADPELAVELATYDGKNATRYPGWREFYDSLETDFEEDEVRRFVRLELRRRVSDDRGKVFAGNGFFGDFEEDPQLQEAIRHVLGLRGQELASVPEYAQVIPPEEPEPLAENGGEAEEG